MRQALGTGCERTVAFVSDGAADGRRNALSGAMLFAVAVRSTMRDDELMIAMVEAY